MQQPFIDKLVDQGLGYTVLSTSKPKDVLLIDIGDKKTLLYLNPNPRKVKEALQLARDMGIEPEWETHLAQRSSLRGNRKRYFYRPHLVTEMTFAVHDDGSDFISLSEWCDDVAAGKNPFRWPKGWRNIWGYLRRKW